MQLVDVNHANRKKNIKESAINKHGSLKRNVTKANNVPGLEKLKSKTIAISLLR